MTITQSSPDRVVIKGKQATVTIGKEVQIGDYTIPGAGEYDVAGIHCEGQYLSEGAAFFLQVEDIVLCYLTQPHADLLKVDNVSDTDILIVDLRSDDTAAALKPIIKAVEPSYVYLLNSTGRTDLITELNLPVETVPILKVTAGTLPAEPTPTLVQA
jgi:hypothetical protein